MSFFNELKRRNVVRMGLLYIVASWVVLQIADVIFDPLGVPAWVFRLIMSLLALGLPFALVFAWIFELTPEGIKLERNVDRSHSIVGQTGQRMNFVIVGLLVLAIGGLVADRLIPRSVAPESVAVDDTAPSAATPDVRADDDTTTVAVLPFVNMSGDDENEYFSDGLTEELLNSLVRLGGLKVTGRTSSFAFKGKNIDLREIGQLLNVSNVLEGSVRKAGNRVRITAQLVKTSDGYHLWSETFDRELDDIFGIQAEIADQVSRNLHVTLLGDAQADQPVVVSASTNAEAYELYLRGMYLTQSDPDGEESLDRAVDFFNRALEIDETYVEPYWGLFNTWNRINRNGYASYDVSGERMAFYSDELKKRAPESDMAFVAAGRLAIREREYQKAVESLEQAVHRFSGSANAQSFYSQALLIWTTALAINGREEEAAQALEKATRAIELAAQLDPLSVLMMQTQANLLSYLGDCASVKRLLDKALELDPEVGRIKMRLAVCLYFSEGDIERALSIAEKEPLAFARDTLMAIFLNMLGDREAADQRLKSMMADYGESAAYQYGQVYTQFGETEKAFEWLEKAVEIHDPGITLSAGDPFLTPLHGDPRFEEILRAAGF